LAEDETAYYHIVLKGSVHIEEPQVHHLEGTSGTKQQLRITTCPEGKGFHHFPLVMKYTVYGYTATADDHFGACIVKLSKDDYIRFISKTIDREMQDTVHMLKTTPFFSSWSDTSICRLYFWFERRRLPPESDVVTQGDEADFCFIIRSGRCDVLVEVAEEEDEASSCGSRMSPVGSPLSHRAAETSSSPSASPAFNRANSEGVGGATGNQSDGKDGAARARKKMLKMTAAAAFKESTARFAPTDDAPPLRLNVRHVVTLRPGAIVGEIALLPNSDAAGEKRLATVRTSETVEVLILDKSSFLDLDRSTLNIIAENARYNAACTKEPSKRTREDLQILQTRTAHLSHLAALPTDIHLELCRVMRYQKISEHTFLVRKGAPATCLYVLISGACSTYTAEPTEKGSKRRGWSVAVSVKNNTLGRRKTTFTTVDSFSSMKPAEVLHSGHAIGADELLQEDPICSVTAITNEPVELMEIERKDFDHILKADRTSEKGRLIDFIHGLSVMTGVSVAAVHAFSNALTHRTYMRDQLCLAYPPDPSLGASSYSNDYVYIIYGGEARLLCGAADGTPPPTIDYLSPPYGPLIEKAPPPASRVERALGHNVAAVATLGPGEVIIENLLTASDARWCLQPITPLDLLVVPRKDWQDTLRSTSLAELRELTQARAVFFARHLEAALNKAAASSVLHRQPSGAIGRAGGFGRVHSRAQLEMAESEPARPGLFVGVGRSNSPTRVAAHLGRSEPAPRANSPRAVLSPVSPLSPPPPVSVALPPRSPRAGAISPAPQNPVARSSPVSARWPASAASPRGFTSSVSPRKVHVLPPMAEPPKDGKHHKGWTPPYQPAIVIEKHSAFFSRPQM